MDALQGCIEESAGLAATAALFLENVGFRSREKLQLQLITSSLGEPGAQVKNNFTSTPWNFQGFGLGASRCATKPLFEGSAAFHGGATLSCCYRTVILQLCLIGPKFGFWLAFPVSMGLMLRGGSEVIFMLRGCRPT
jgi:hypothetical protein